MLNVKYVDEVNQAFQQTLLTPMQQCLLIGEFEMMEQAYGRLTQYDTCIAYLNDTHEAELNQTSVQICTIEQTTVLQIREQRNVEFH